MLKSIKIKTADFLDTKVYRENPIQRDTAKRAAIYNKKSGHLSELHPTMCRVSAAQLPNGKIFVLDGHTRRHLWAADKMQVPNELWCDMYEVPNEQAAMAYYLTFDNTMASETGGDRQSGAMKFLKFTPGHKAMFNSTGIQRAIDYLIFPNKRGDIRHLSMVEKLKPWIPTFIQMDMLESFYVSQRFPSPIIAAFMLSVRRDGNQALEFWQMYHDDAGMKHQKTFDGVFLAGELHREWRNPTTILQYKKNRIAAFSEITPKFLHCYDNWMEDRRFDIAVGTGRNRWKHMMTVPEWWREYIGEYDHPQIREQTELELELDLDE